MNTQAFTGKLIRLASFDADHDAELFARWSQNSEFQQLLDSGPAKLLSPKQLKEWMENHYGELYNFSIRTLDDDQVIGFIDLSGIDWVTGNAWVGIGIGPQELWGKGYGTDAMKQILRFGFGQLNLKRVSLNVFEYNERAAQSYRRAGFKEEGRLRQWMQRGGERYDLIYMGILRQEWEALQQEPLKQGEEVKQAET